MAREVNSTQPYQDKLVKLIPTEIVGGYMVIAGLLGYGADTMSTSDGQATSIVTDAALNATLIQVVFFALLFATPLSLWKVSSVTNKIQLSVTTLAFAIWVYTLGGPFVVWSIYYPKVGSVVLVLWSIFVPLLVQSTDSPPEGQ